MPISILGSIVRKDIVSGSCYLYTVVKSLTSDIFHSAPCIPSVFQYIVRAVDIFCHFTLRLNQNYPSVEFGTAPLPLYPIHTLSIRQCITHVFLTTVGCSVKELETWTRIQRMKVISWVAGSSFRAWKLKQTVYKNRIHLSRIEKLSVGRFAVCRPGRCCTLFLEGIQGVRCGGS